MLGQPLNWRNLSLTLSLLVGGSLSGLLLHLPLTPAPIAIAQTAEATKDSSFLQGLLQLNQDFLAARPALQQLPVELTALDRKNKAFDAQYFATYIANVKALQQKIGVLETQFGNFQDPQQRLAIKAELEALQLVLQNFLAVSEPFAAGFNPKAIRQTQEFLDFFDRLKLPNSSYGFYGTVTANEMSTYIDKQLVEFSNTLKQLNQIATKGAIAPDLATSINHLYTTISLESILNDPNGKFQQHIERLEKDNEELEQQIQSTHRIILFLPLIVMLPTTMLVFILFYYFGKIFQEKAEHPGNYQFSLNDIYGLEEELVARLVQKYDLKPKLLERRNDPFANKLINFVSNPDAPSVENLEEMNDNSGEGDKNQSYTATANPSDRKTQEVVLDGLFDGEDEDDNDNFPVHLPNIYDELVDRYNEDPSYLEAQAIALSISHQESHLDDEAEFMPMLIFTEDEAGDYWETTFKSIEYLVPKATLAITIENYSNFKNIFICYGYQHDTVQRAKLLKPARVSRAEEEHTWELVQQGIVVLHRI